MGDSNTADKPIPLPPASPALKKWWERHVYELVQTPTPTHSAEQAERHTLFSLMVMALVSRYFNGNKLGSGGEYPWRDKQRLANQIYRGAPRIAGTNEYGYDYLGHNIAAIAVDGRGEIIDFDFNHNELLDSSVEHAESRLVRRVFSLSRIYDTWDVQPKDAKSTSYGNVLNNVTIYTSLESCAQCSGIMTLGQVKEVVYLQTDPGQYRIGDMMFNLAGSGPKPISADTFDFAWKKRLDQGYQDFQANISDDKPFHRRSSDDKKPNKSASMTSFLCTDAALDIFDDAARAFQSFQPQHDINLRIVDGAKRFFAYAANDGNRGTPHTL